MATLVKTVKNVTVCLVAGAVGIVTGYGGVNAYINKDSQVSTMQTAALSVSSIEPAAGTPAKPAVPAHPAANTADTGATDAVQGTVDSTAAPR